ncbi:MAG TPA: outer membrane lipoprotein carrier protein LolA, partial [Gemmatimonadales bacterium]
PLRLSAQAADPVPILDRAARAYAAAGSFEADFRQTIVDENIGTYRSRGHLAQQGTDRFAMRFSDPRGEALVMDGTKLWVYTPSSTPGQVIRMAQPTGAGAPNLVGWLLDRPSERYNSLYRGGDSTAGGTDVVLITPRDAALPFRSAIVTFSRVDGLPRRIDVTDASGMRRILNFTNVRSGRRLRASTFQFQVPNGVRVVDQ